MLRIFIPLHRERRRVNDGRFTGDPAAVSARMKLIRSQGTRAETALFEVLVGLRLPFERHKVVQHVSIDALVAEHVAVFVDSPFWHLRDPETLSRLSPYWQGRLVANRLRDRRQTRALRGAGFTVVRIWADEVAAQRTTRRLRRAVIARGGVRSETLRMPPTLKDRG